MAEWRIAGRGYTGRGPFIIVEGEGADAPVRCVVYDTLEVAKGLVACHNFYGWVAERTGPDSGAKEARLDEAVWPVSF